MSFMSHGLDVCAESYKGNGNIIRIGASKFQSVQLSEKNYW